MRVRDQMMSQRVLADFGEFALHSEDLDEVLTEACRLVGEALGTRRAKIMEIQKDGKHLFVRAGVGWEPDVVGHLRLEMSERSSETFSIKSGKPVISQDIREEDRFEVPDFMKEAGVLSLANVPIFLPGPRAYGLLQVDDVEPRAFEEEDTEFLRTYATILGPVIDRLFKLRDLNAGEERFRLIVEKARDYAIFTTDADDLVADWLPGAEAIFGWTADEIIGRPGHILFTPEDRERGEDEREFETAVTEGLAPNVRWHLRKDGRRVFIEGSVTALRDPTDRLVGFLKIGQDITERREAAERQSFLLKLSDEMRPLSDPIDIQRVVTRAVGESAQAQWAFYLEFDESLDEAIVRCDYTADGAPSMVGRHSLGDMEDLLEAFRASRTFSGEIATIPVLSDRARELYLGIGMRSFVCTPIVKDGLVRAVLTVADVVERDWEPFRQVLEEVAERTWQAVERARAEAGLRASEERFRQFSENSTDLLWMMNAQTGEIEYLSPVFDTMWGEPREHVLDQTVPWMELVHPGDREKLVAALPRMMRGEKMQIEYRIIRPIDGAVRWIIDTSFPVRDGTGSPVRIAGIAQDNTERRLAEEEVREGRQRLQALVEGIPQLVWRAVDGGHWRWASPQWTAYTGLPEEDSRGLGWLDVLHPEDRERTMAAWAEAGTRQTFDVEHRIRHAGEARYRWFRTRAAPLRHKDGAAVEWLGTSTDVDDLRRLQDEQKVVLAELQHRARNLLAIIRSTARKTLTPGPEVEEFAGRLAALSRVQGFLARSDKFSVQLEEIVRAEIEAHGDGGGVEIEGPAIDLPGEKAQTFALALHELATNAVKHGALSVDSGQLGVLWRIEAADGAQHLVLEWSESGVPVAQAVAADESVSRRTGYGRELIERALPYQLGAQTRLAFEADGVRCSIRVPLAALVASRDGD